MKIFSRLMERFRRRSSTAKAADPTERWRERARRLGRRAVYHVGHPDEELDKVTALQRSILFPVVREHLLGTEELVLDFGCGPGRFTPELAAMIGGRAIGVDVVPEFFAMAPSDPSVSYSAITDGRIPLDDGAADVVWICLVLGGLDEEPMLRAVSEIRRVLRPGGLVVLVENTSVRTDSQMWRYRSSAVYASVFGPPALRLATSYEDLGETISVFVGRLGAERKTLGEPADPLGVAKSEADRHH